MNRNEHVTTLPARVLTTPIGPALDLDALAARAAGLAEDARAPNTRRAYRADGAHFAGWCAAQGFVALPDTPETVGLYLAAHEARLSVATLTRRL